jgi:hypothetical protein
VLVEQGIGGKGAREEVDCRGWGPGVEALQPLKGGAAVEGNEVKVTGGEAERGQATEQLGG